MHRIVIELCSRRSRHRLGQRGVFKWPRYVTCRVWTLNTKFVCLSVTYLITVRLSAAVDVLNTHSLTAALDQLRVVASSTSNDPGPRSRQHQHHADRPTSSSTCCSQFLRGRPGGRFQSAAGVVPVWASIDS